MLTKYTPGVGATYDRFTGWWGGTAPLDGVDVTYYTRGRGRGRRAAGGQIDLIGQIQLATDRALFNNSNVQIFKARGATHREMCDAGRRQQPAHATTACARRSRSRSTARRSSRQLFNGLADLGNDSPFAPVYGLAQERAAAQEEHRRWPSS